MIQIVTSLCLAAIGVLVLAAKPGRWIVRFATALAAVDAALAAWVCFGPHGMAVESFFGDYVLIDASVRVFLLVTTLVWGGVALYVESRVASAPEVGEGIHTFIGWALLFVAAAKLMILCGDILLGWVLLEATTFAAVPLILFRRTRSSSAAAWKYFLISSVGLSLTLLGFAFLERGRFAIASGADGFAWTRIGASLVVLGYGTKLGLAPMYSWLPDTYDSAPPATTALLASIQATCATIALARAIEHFDAGARSVVQPELIAIGLASMLVGGMNIVAATNFKKLLAYASISHAGVIALGLGVARPAAYGLVIYVVCNAFVKALLFLTAGHIKSVFRTKEIRELSGLLKEVPYSGLLLLLGTFALLGFAPFGSFWGELLIFGGLIQGGHFAVFAATGVILTVTFVATGRSFFPMIWGETIRPASRTGLSRASVYASFFFLAILLSIGIYVPAQVNAAFLEAATRFGGN